MSLLRPLALRTTLTPLLRPLPSASRSSPFHSTSLRTDEKKSAKEVHPADIVAQAHVGPATVHEKADVIAAEVVSDAPVELQHRTVRIYKPTRNTMQTAKGKTKKWMLDWDVLQSAGRWENPLMGWASSADYMQGTTMKFDSKEDAIAFAEKQGWDYQIQTPKSAKIPPKQYANNYVHIPGKLRIHHTK